VLLLAVPVVALVLVGLTAESLGEPRPAADVLTAPRAEAPSRYAGVGTWLSRYRFTCEFGGATPPLAPADDPAYPGLLSIVLLGEFLTRAHAPTRAPSCR
jgi:hypothetical protein